MRIGIVGLPNVGKSTLFKALTNIQVDISNYPFCTINPNIGVTRVPDKRLEKIADIVKPEKIIPAVIEFVDIAGLVKGAHKGEGLGNQFLSHIYNVDAILLVLRCFKDAKITHVESEINPERDFNIIKEELYLKDLELANKPQIIICNTKGEKDNAVFEKCNMEIDFKLELEMSEMKKNELEELEIKSKIPDLIKLAYQTLELITFYTVKGGKELRASSLKQGETAPQAGRRIHGDFEEKFIRAEVVACKDFIKMGGWAGCREKGLLRTEGRDYIVRDNDILEFKI
ncbi:MAG: redox-regulated ATPase YchF [Candidatus Tagabacteria bacterium CG09_land_8_20_14_0_10_41_14]|uniref:Redox-regulated ATPase YchF n=2 Tax=Candidatus Tagaibacteriota TaxID=1817918 RepID=A0A2H0WLJ5_9BACT|nr:MAG: redox-regulated ATPase YchF [Candidatus Tagabacteria bacterium CG09_land_8_20_14_0_10_41_14]PJE73058.1 MAG: redox-regulated ATPase YchF [Candidatus Tagabacteria bacterium CG10_big_fil_rev_8_21_14_0_10_40_13]